MKDYFAFFIKLVVGSGLFLPSVDSAVCDRFLSENEARAFARSYWKDIDNWEGVFVLKDGSVIKHTKHDITLEKDGVVVQSLKREFLIEQRNGNEYHAIDLRMPLSRADFLCRLCESELYQKTKQDKKVLATNSNWEAEISVVDLTINDVECCTVWHKPDGVRFKLKSGESINLSRWCINKYGYIQYSSHTYSTKELFLMHKENGRPVCLSAELSCIEFTKTLFDCGHIIFSSYPPYTIQGMSDGRFTYYYYGDLEKPEWVEEYIAAKVAESRMKQEEENKRKEEDKKRKEKEALRAMWKKEHEAHKLVRKTQQEKCTNEITANQKNNFNLFNPISWIKFYAPKKIGV